MRRPSSSPRKHAHATMTNDGCIQTQKLKAAAQCQNQCDCTREWACMTRARSFQESFEEGRISTNGRTPSPIGRRGLDK